MCKSFKFYNHACDNPVQTPFTMCDGCQKEMELRQRQLQNDDEFQEWLSGQWADEQSMYSDLRVQI